MLERLKSGPITLSLVSLATVFALGAGTAVAAELITGADIRDNSVLGKDIRDRSLGTVDLSRAAIADVRGISRVYWTADAGTPTAQVYLSPAGLSLRAGCATDGIVLVARTRVDGAVVSRVVESVGIAGGNPATDPVFNTAEPFDLDASRRDASGFVWTYRAPSGAAVELTGYWLDEQTYDDVDLATDCTFFAMVTELP